MSMLKWCLVVIGLFLVVIVVFAAPVPQRDFEGNDVWIGHVLIDGGYMVCYENTGEGYFPCYEIYVPEKMTCRREANEILCGHPVQ